MIPVSTSLIRLGHRYFLLRALADSMTEAGIDDGALVLVRQQPSAEVGDVIFALVKDEATIKELKRPVDAIVLMPRRMNDHKEKCLLCTCGHAFDALIIESRSAKVLWISAIRP